MGSLPVRQKKPSERRSLVFDFSEKLAAGDALTSVPTATGAAGLTVGAVTRTGNEVTVPFSGGAAGTSYNAQVVCDTTLGDTLHEDVTIAVANDPDGVVRKQPDELRTYTFDYRDKLLGPDQLFGSATITITPSGVLVVNGTPTVDTQVVNVRLQNGTDGVDYSVLCSIPTVAGDILVLEATVEVREREN